MFFERISVPAELTRDRAGAPRRNLELHVIPGHFIAGAIGTIALLVAVVLAFGYGFLTVALQSLAVAIVLSALMIGLSWRILPRSAFAQRLVFKPAQGPEYVASDDYSRFLDHTGYARLICMTGWRPSMVSGSTSSRKATSFKREPRFASAVSKARASSCAQK
jgi:hypothetical protein